MTTRRPITREIASSRDASDVAHSFVGELAEPRDEILSTHGRGDLDLYARLKRDDQVHACLQQRIGAVVSRDWSVEPGGPSARDKAAAEDLRQTLTHIRFDDVTRKMLTGLWYGYAVAECLWASDGGRVRLDAIRVRRPGRFAFDRDGGLRLLQPGKPDGIALPERKFWAFTAGADDDDDVYGRGLAYWCYWPVWLKRNGLKFWSIWMEKFAAPTAKGTVPRGASVEEKRALMQALRAVTQDSAMVIPEGTDAELLQSLRSAGGDYQAFVQQMNAAISKVILSQTMTTDDGSSRAQAEVHAGVALQVVKADADLVCESFNDTVARWLTDWNHPGAAYPRVWRDVSEAEDLAARAERDQMLVQIGYRPTPDYIERVYGEGFEPIPQPAPATLPAPSGPAFAEPVAEPATGDQDRDTVDDLADQLDDLARPATDAWIDEIRRILDTSDTVPHAIERLERLYPDLDLDALAGLIGDALSVADLHGRAELLE